MAKKSQKKKKKPNKKIDFQLNDRNRLMVGLVFIFMALLLFGALISFFFNWKSDQSNLVLSTEGEPAQNLVGKLGALTGHLLIYKGFGLMALLIPYGILYSGLLLIAKKPFYNHLKRWFWIFIYLYTGAFLFALLFPSNYIWSGLYGKEIAFFANQIFGKLGSILILFFGLMAIISYKFSIDAGHIHQFVQSLNFSLYKQKKKPHKDGIKDDFVTTEQPSDEPLIPTQEVGIMELDDEMIIKNPVEEESVTQATSNDKAPKPNQSSSEATETGMNIRIAGEEEITQKAAQLVSEQGPFDPRRDLPDYQFPPFDLLKDYGATDITYNEKELKRNKDKIVKTLLDFKIKISKIEVVVGPSVTLYEIIPEAGVRISKIKNLEDDIALSLAALGIRIIAPMPGKGTIGIEVPNKIRRIVPMRSVLQSRKFQEAEMELPVAMGKTITNETFTFDLTKMPHLLVAGATGQGKSVGINAILASLLYKKHPSELKFVLVDPKKVELTLYNKIERHFLAKLPDEEEAIITDVSKVVKTLNSLTKEMDARYDLLKDAMVRNIKEYNEKFKKRLLNPENGHRYLPYIVLVIDEFADLMMTAGKEIELPIARIAQLARAVGIHLIVATQRPSVNVITGMIKANFPARIAFAVTSKIDSRTILDSGGAERLIGKGDMLITTGNDLVRLQCAFIDTPEVENLTGFIGAQRGYASAFPLPEVDDENAGTNFADNEDDRDELFKEAAYLIVNAQQGSTSLLQRKLKLGYNRAGRIIDQLEAAGIVGPFEGSKARKVLIPDIITLDEFFNKQG